MATHSDGILVSASGVNTPHEEANGHLQKTVKSLPPHFYTDFLSDTARERQPSPILELFPLEKKPGVISLLAGKPSDAMFPFKSFSFTIASPTDPSQEQSISLSGKDLSVGLQYCDTAGIPRLIEWFMGLQERSHGRKSGEGWRLTIGAGSQDLIYKAVNALVNPGDSVLVESPVYAGVIPMLKTLHCEQIG
ncbi:hypothetical protein AZE42_13310, partial [Rhizopogon vesiculosus]